MQEACFFLLVAAVLGLFILYEEKENCYTQSLKNNDVCKEELQENAKNRFFISQRFTRYEKS